LVAGLFVSARRYRKKSQFEHCPDRDRGQIGAGLKSISILVIDDSAVFLRMAKLFLQDLEDVEVVGTAGGGKSGIEQTLRLRPDIVLVDLSMPDLHGLNVIPKLREALPATHIIALTMLDEDGFRRVSLASGAHDFISKTRMHTDLPPVIYRLAGRPEPSKVMRE
jgi:two-component system response regulator NreC